MQFKQAQIDKYLKKPDDVLRCAVIYGSNEGLQAEYVKKFTTAVCPDPYDPFRVVYLNGSDVNGDPGILFGEYNGQSLMGGRRVVIVRDGDNNLTKHVKALLENNVSDTLLIVSSGSLNKKSSLVRLAEENENMAAIACYEDRDEDIFNSTRAKFIENGITIGNEALQLLCARLSNDRMSNSGEIEKLITYLGDHKNVTVEDVQKIISDASSSSGDDVCFAAAGGYADGYDVRIAKIIADQLGMELEIVKTEWDGLTPALLSGNIDVIIAGMSPTAERRMTIDFTDSYYDTELTVVVRKDSAFAGAKSLADLAGA